MADKKNIDKDIRETLSMLVHGNKGVDKLQPLMGTNQPHDESRPDEKFAKSPIGKGKNELAAAVKKQAEDKWLKDPGIRGIGMGNRTTNGKKQKEKSLKVYVVEKEKNSKLKIRIPSFLAVDGLKIPIDVEPVGELKIHRNTSRRDLVQPGCSIFHGAENQAGTFGCLVFKADDNRPMDERQLYILSNSHVIARKSRGCNVGDAIVHPGKEDSDGDEFKIAELFEWVLFQTPSSSLLNTCDAAIAKVVSDKVSSVIFGLKHPPTGTNLRPMRGMKVRKSGRTTDLGLGGTILDVDFVAKNLTYGRRKLTFHHQVLCSNYAEEGDSGSVVLDSRNKAIGLHFAGSADFSVFNRIGFVLNTFNVRIVTKKINPPNS